MEHTDPSAVTHYEFINIKSEVDATELPSPEQELNHFIVKEEDVKPAELEAKFNSSEASLEIEELHFKLEEPQPVSQRHRFKCVTCGYSTNHKSHFKQHVLTHCSKEQFVCFMCGLVCREESSLKNHDCTFNKKPPFACDSCRYVGCSDQNLSDHKKNFHSKSGAEKQFKCYACDYSSTSKTHLRDHSLEHEAHVGFKCTTCNFRTKWKSCLRRHLVVCKTRSDQERGLLKEYKCSVCAYTTFKNGYWLRHMARHKVKGRFDEVEKEYVCNYMKTSLRKHYRCDKCDYNSEDIKLLMVHMGTH